MITLIDIANKLQEKEEESNHWIPIRCTEYTLPDLVIPTYDCKNGEFILRTQLSKVYAFIDYIKYLRFSDGCTIIPLATTNSKLMSIWGSTMGVSRGIKFMIDLGLISPENTQYQFDAFYDSDNKCKTYRYYVDNERILLGTFKHMNIDKYYDIQTNYIGSNTIVNKHNHDIEYFEKDRVRFNSQLYLKRPEDMSTKEFELYLTKCLYDNYKNLAFYQQKADEINERFYKGTPFMIKFVPQFTWRRNTAVTKISIRATNSLCGLRKDYRQVFLKENGFDIECDIKSSVPRLTISLNNGKWFDDYNVDIYEEVWNAYKYYAGIEHDDFPNEAREAIKTLHLRSYFEMSSKQLCHHVWRNINKRGVKNEDIGDVYDIMTDFKAAIKKVEGDSFGSEIFYVESCVYLMTLYDLLTSGIFTWQVYDCFYSKNTEGISEEQFREMIYSEIKQNFDDFIITL